MGRVVEPLRASSMALLHTHGGFLLRQDDGELSESKTFPVLEFGRVIIKIVEGNS